MFILNFSDPLLELQACIHPTVMKDMCAECGADLRKDDLITTASVPMIHSVPELKVSVEVNIRNFPILLFVYGDIFIYIIIEVNFFL